MQALDEDLLCNDQQSYSTVKFTYGEKNKYITIPESIGYIKLFIDEFRIPLEEKKELLVTLTDLDQEFTDQVSKLVEEKLPKIKSQLGDDDISKEKITNRAEFHKLLNNVDDDKVSKLFKEISGLDVEKVWREQKEFVLLQQIHMAATEYGQIGSACPKGIWRRIIQSVGMIDQKLMDSLHEYQKEKMVEQLGQEDFVKNLANELIRHAEKDPKFKTALVDDFILGIIDLDKPEKVSLEQQMVFAKINQEFESTKGFLFNYRRPVPKKDEYKIIINQLLGANQLQVFTQKTEQNETSDPQIKPTSNESRLAAK
ncbi:hypothetical protein [Candidatus Wolbachia massiliensis]|uniref:Uncharacterized protein n=1 Tax=Candidatus Wolbachia massiliensis TaxID=1845000 RepID=A0A7M3U2F1_9RICK|nr:hypothetical protein [Candidatus Wolbachia massiliensis]QOD38586.1 hypothetical protein ID128_01750 [Candidatus Wolbachia massiliensis]